MRRVAAIAAALPLACLPGLAAEAAEIAWRAAGFQTPESVLFDEANDRLIVSNIAGDPMEADGNGHLSTLSLDGETIEAQWAAGMDAPKGMGIADGRLYVADIGGIHVVDLASGELVETLAVEGAVFLNDVAAGTDGSVFVSDMMADTIYRVADGTVEAWLEDEALSMPNGLWVDGDRLLVGTWGRNMQPDFSTEELGGLVAVDLETREITAVPQAESFGNIDGVVTAGGAVYVTDFVAGLVYRIAEGAAPEAFATLGTGSADLGTDGTMLFVPMMMEGEVVALPVE